MRTFATNALLATAILLGGAMLFAQDEKDKPLTPCMKWEMA